AGSMVWGLGGSGGRLTGGNDRKLGAHWGASRDGLCPKSVQLEESLRRSLGRRALAYVSKQGDHRSRASVLEGGRPGLSERYDSQKGGVFMFSPPSPQSRPNPVVSFDRKELALILNVYGRKVAAGEWRDYALDFGRERAMFSIYQRASERPLYVVEKNPKLARRQGQYMVSGTDGRILKRGHDLAAVLRIFDPQLYLVR